MCRFTPALQSQLGFGEFGYAPDRADKTDPMDGFGQTGHLAALDG